MCYLVGICCVYFVYLAAPAYIFTSGGKRGLLVAEVLHDMFVWDSLYCNLVKDFFIGFVMYVLVRSILEGSGPTVSIPVLCNSVDEIYGKSSKVN